MNNIIVINNNKYINLSSIIAELRKPKNLKEHKKLETEFIIKYKKFHKENLIKKINKKDEIYLELENDFLKHYNEERTTKTRKLSYYLIEEKDFGELMGAFLTGASNGKIKKDIKEKFTFITSKNGKVYSKDKDKYINDRIKRVYEVSENIYKELTGVEKPAKEIIEMGGMKSNKLSTLMDLVYPLYEKVYRDCVEDIAIKMPLLYGDNVLKSSFYRFFTLGIVKEDKDLSKYSVKDYEVLKKHLESYVNKLGYKFTDDKKLLTIPKEEQKYKTWYYTIEKELANNVIIEILDINLHNMKKEDIKSYINFMIEKDILVENRVEGREKALLPKEYLDLITEDVKKNNIENRYAYTNRKLKDKECFELLECTLEQSYFPNIVNTRNLIQKTKEVWEDKKKIKNMLINEIDKYYELLYKKNYIELCLSKNSLYDEEYFLIKEMYKIDKETTKNYIGFRKKDLWKQLKEVRKEIRLQVDFLTSITKEQLEGDKLYHKNSLLLRLYA